MDDCQGQNLFPCHECNIYCKGRREPNKRGENGDFEFTDEEEHEKIAPSGQLGRAGSEQDSGSLVQTGGGQEEL